MARLACVARLASRARLARVARLASRARLACVTKLASRARLACVARGFIPVRLRSSRRFSRGRLRRPTGINPLTTENHLAQKNHLATDKSRLACVAKLASRAKLDCVARLDSAARLACAARLASRARLACVARGFIPVRLRSSRRFWRGRLRRPTGINPLATENHLAQKITWPQIDHRVTDRSPGHI